ncbi:hypothetical protein Gbro_4214 [Gordonia bronchialis DSM 43247]|mgnify:CR=1 FL=1|jgi:ferredoxin|uniref:Ferredoxin n=1 Tax=Gordonia bronchialis (strain ATCC 25592 / DSM 43247 / BCRC 13721 / JCM 3198 / KCTC 3076 / NBRC 16047 / NCTC 10667) TaxID=526226 RepID=D0L5A8_GORB4|nr:ferredoxin [Gordonia bronchialis]ACY23366.1 hypothetical protein Gbro_4214 [Gordonia bronchialis DSM 43247]MCC3321534.1 ferredoxin [Gordonia bronchialis]QGS23253.1 ferredoxin [Gordonia bronchialis]UAK36381.1 ferredoxin [Gordonia bronchialis]STQ66353.1 Ferredoxin [Gordonia bronchialis]
MSTIHVDRPACEGIGMCEAQAHEYFQIGDDGLVAVPNPDVPDSDRAHVRAAVDSCPVSALRIVD